MPVDKKYKAKDANDLLQKITKIAQKDPQRIVFPEGTEPRILKAVSELVKKKILIPILIGETSQVQKQLQILRINLKNVQIVDPITGPDYVQELFELRKEKGLTIDQAKHQLTDSVYYATMMVKCGDADGLVCGARHKTAETLKPAFQIIKTVEGVSTASSYFVMLVGKQVYFYADCAVNPDPTAEQLADIAITTADTAKSFGYVPKVAMLSFATHGSATHALVDKVQHATDLIKSRRPDIIVDGPVQFDTAVVHDVCMRKAPQSPLKGEANVLVFPDLNCGNIAYKITQRFAHARPIGPIIQGLNKPVNDLSIGATIEEIVETATLTCVQAIRMKE